MKKLSYLIVAALFLSACAKEQLPQANYDIVPQPKELTVNEEKLFGLSPKTVIRYEDGLQREAQFLSEYVDDIMGFAMVIQEYQGQTDGIVLKLSPDDFDQAEAYEINITPKQVTIKGADASGVFYGIQTLRKHAHILIEIRQQNKFPERIQTLARITRQPVCYYVFFCSFHTQINPAKNVPKPILFPL